MPSTRIYHFVHPTPWTQEGGHDAVRRVLDFLCDKYWWYEAGEVRGEALGLMQFSFRVTGEEQWRAHKRAMILAACVYRNLGLHRRDVPVPLWRTLPPHTNRGRYRVAPAPKGSPVQEVHQNHDHEGQETQ